MENKKYLFDNEYDKNAKCRWQERIKKGLPVDLYFLNNADKEDLEYYHAYLEWLNDDKPVED